MGAIEEGKACTLLKGRRAGEKVTVTKIVGNFAVVKTEGGKERKAAVKHLRPLEKK